MFWQVGSSATLGTGTEFEGNILAKTSITATTGANIDGRLLAENGAVTLDDNLINVPPAEVIGGSASVPEKSSTLLLLGSALAALVVIRRRVVSNQAVRAAWFQISQDFGLAFALSVR